MKEGADLSLPPPPPPPSSPSQLQRTSLDRVTIQRLQVFLEQVIFLNSKNTPIF